MSTRRTGTLFVELASDRTTPPTEIELRVLFRKNGFQITQWNPLYRGGFLHSLTCDLRWETKGSTEPHTPASIHELTASPAVVS